ncbi:4-amino-4-deoxy-L-arabinose transferase [Micromonospora coriariae]|uniref:4-amino-4-deoxy-L-arabinose transferase n=1 Tax=Micromonospora coriariae TaxID=285665 RepID=A0A1C4UH23_9ACTN|nr:4-amino-4-deoxy-L-arabinose transferase [Micromonospora coriariae]
MKHSGRDDDGGVVVSNPDPEQHRGRWRPRLDRPALVALLLGLAGVGYRLVLTLYTVPVSNSDEATFGLAALHIAQGRERPVFLYGQHYMGMLESYLAAPLVALTGPSWPVLRLPMLALYAVFLYLIHRLTRRLCAPWFAAFVVGLLALGPERVVRDQLTVVGGRPEVKPAVLLMLLITVGLAAGTVHHRRLAVGLFGLLVGLAAWSDWLILPYLAVAGLALVWAVRRELVGWSGLLLVAGFVVGVAPMIYDNLRAPPGADSLSVFREVSTKAGPLPPWSERIRGGLLEGVPLAHGLCPVDGCGRWQQWFGLLYPVLLVVAAVLAVLAYRRAAGASRGERARPVVQLALVVGAALTLLSYVRTPLAATSPLDNARYLSVLQLSLPAVLWPLWVAAVACWRGTVGALGRLTGALATAVLAALTATTLVITVLFATTGVGASRTEERHARELAGALRANGPHEVYGDYWTCNRLIFNTDETVICGVLDGDLSPGQNRYLPYWRQVGRAERPGYVVEAGSPMDRRLRRLLADRPDAAPVREVGGYRVYHPDTPVRPWR